MSMKSKSGQTKEFPPGPFDHRFMRGREWVPDNRVVFNNRTNKGTVRTTLSKRDEIHGRCEKQISFVILYIILHTYWYGWFIYIDTNKHLIWFNAEDCLNMFIFSEKIKFTTLKKDNLRKYCVKAYFDVTE